MQKVNLVACVSGLVHDPVPADLQARHFAGSLINLVMWWYENGMEPNVEKMDEYFQYLTMKGLKGLQ